MGIKGYTQVPDRLMKQLILSLQKQTDVMTALALSNERLAGAVAQLIEAEEAQDAGDEPTSYLDGKPSH